MLLHHMFGEVNGKKGRWGHVSGGMGGITQAMAKSAEAQGVEIEVSAPVQEVIVKITGPVESSWRTDGDPRKSHRCECQPEVIIPEISEPGMPGYGFQTSDRSLPLCFRNVSHERGIG